MNSLKYRNNARRIAAGLLGASILALVSACSSESASAPPTGDFQIRSSNADLVLLEGDQNGVRIPLTLTRNNGHDRPVTLEVRGRTEEDVAFVTSSFSRLTLTPSEDDSEAVLKLAIANAPILPQQREFIIIAKDGVDTAAIPVSVSVQPTSAPDVYLLAGQSNMVGFSGDGTRRSGPGEEDAPNSRIKQLNVSGNDDGLFANAAAFISADVNLVQPDIVTALDPLHVPQDPTNDNGKDLEYIGMGLSFAKSALNDTVADVILVPAAWSGSTFCKNIGGPAGNWMPLPSNDPDLGNTWLFDRAVVRANLALQKSGGVFRGILWHQGESEANDIDRCAQLYTQNLKLMVEQMRERINSVGSPALRRMDAIIPFILGTMSRGANENGDLSIFLNGKQVIDDAHRSFPSIVYPRVETVVENGVEKQINVNVPIYAGLSDNNDLVPAQGYSCGNDSCIHFGPSALREMGRRYYQALKSALAQEKVVVENQSPEPDPG